MSKVTWVLLSVLVLLGGRVGAGLVRERQLPPAACPNQQLMAGGRLVLPAFNGAEVVLRLGARNASVSGHSSFLAVAEGQTELCSAVVVQTADGFVARVQDLSTGHWLSFVRSEHGLSVRESAPESRAAGACRTRSLRALPTSSAKLAQIVSSEASFDKYRNQWLARGETSTNRVDILVAYDISASTWVRENYGPQGVAAFAEECVAKMNLVLANSGLDDAFSFNLAGTTVVDFNAQTVRTSANGSSFIDFDKLLDFLVGGSAATWKQIREARENTSADIVTFLVDNGDVAPGDTYLAGLGYSLDAQGLSRADDFGDYTFNVCSIRDVAEGHTMTHEVGHNMGAGHGDSTQMNPAYWVVGPQLFNYSAAHFFTVLDDWGERTRYFTVMGYNNDGYPGTSLCVEAPYFSSPERTFVQCWEDGDAIVTNDTGVAVGSELHDNVRTLRETYAIAANYRPHKMRLAVAIPSGGGTVTGGGTYQAGSGVKLVAQPLADCVFAGWYAAYDETTATYLDPIPGLDYRTSTVGYWVPSEDTTLYARFVKKADDRSVSVICQCAETGYAAGVAVSNLAVRIESCSLPTVTVKNLPAGLKFDAKTGAIIGTPTKPGRYEFVVSAKNFSGAMVSVVVGLKVNNFTDHLVSASEDLPDGLQDVYGPFTPGVAVDLSVPPLAGWGAAGLPAGLKFDKMTGRITGRPTKPGTTTATFTAKLKDAPTGKTVTHTATATFVVGDYPEMPVAVAWSTADDTPVDPDSTLTLTAGVFQRFTVSIEGLEGTPTSLAAKNLPAGLKLVKTPVKNDRNAVVDYRYTIEGAPTMPSKMKNGVVVPSVVRLTASNKYKWSGVLDFQILVEELPAWAQGSFSGFSADVSTNGVGLASLTVSAAGKIAGKFAVAGTNWTIAATGYSARIAEGTGKFRLETEAQSGKILRPLIVEVVPGDGEFSGCSQAECRGENLVLSLRRDAWKDKILTATYPVTAIPIEGYAGLSMKATAVGKVTFSGKLDTGFKVSGASVVFYSLEEGFWTWMVLPVKKDFPGLLEKVKIK